MRQSVQFTRAALACALSLAAAPLHARGPADPPVRAATPHAGEAVVRVSPRSPIDAALVDSVSHDRWSCTVLEGRAEADYLIHLDDLRVLDTAGVPYRIIIEDVEALLRADEEARASGFEDRAFFDDFQDFSAVRNYVASLVTQYPDMVKRITLGFSLQSREIFGYRVTSAVPAVGGSPRKPVVFIMSLQHAREWITPMATLFTASYLLENYQSDAGIRDILDRYELVFVPLCNPDGYVNSWASDRLWRKNMRAATNQFPFGVDNNRNWSYGWGLSSGSSSSQSSETYRGTAAFSEPENQAIANYALQIPKVFAALDVHSYAGMVLRPWSYQSTKPPGLASFDRIGNAMLAEITARTGITYEYGGPEILYLSSGTAPDWAFGTLGAVSFTVELSSPNGGFVPPASSIIGTSNEALAAVLSMITRLCPADFNMDNAVDDQDFQLFVASYDLLLTNAGDLTGDGLTEDSDFSLFCAAYDALTCP
ncbi:MAG: M14 family zinc carboxypeptidase [Phycisphaerales bacterium]